MQLESCKTIRHIFYDQNLCSLKINKNFLKTQLLFFNPNLGLFSLILDLYYIYFILDVNKI